MPPKFFTAEEIHGLLDTRELVSVLKKEFASLAEKRARNSSRLVLPLANGRALGAMLAEADGGRLLGAKVVCVFPENRKLDLNPHQGVVTLFHPETGKPLAFFDAAEITAVRTAALSAAATDALAREDAATLALFGAGGQAYSHALAIAKVRALTKIHVWGRTLVGPRALAARLERELGIETIPTKDVVRATGADILALCTPATVPYLSARDLAPGVHVNAIGACRPGMRELEVPLESAAKIFIDDLERTKEEAEEMAKFFEAGQAGKLTEIGHVFSEKNPGRTSARDLTVFKSVGVGLQDVTTAALAFRKSWQGADL